MIKPVYYLYLATGLLVHTSIVPAGADFHPLEDITGSALAYVRTHIDTDNADVELSARDLDPRLRLAKCHAPLEAFTNQASPFTGNVTVGIRCHDAKPWMIYVPVSVQVYQTIAVASRPLSQNSILSSTDIKLLRLDVSRIPGGIIDNSSELVGMKLMRPVRMDQPISGNMVKRPIKVRRGDRVTLLARSPVVEVRMEGEALMDASTGDRVRVKNLRSKRTVEGLLTEEGNTVLVY